MLTLLRMNNFIVGQVTPDMITGISWGTFLIFGILIITGAAFIWFYVPETSRLTLEEMDIVFGSSGVAQEDQARMLAINEEIGLEERVRQLTGRSSSVAEAGAFAGEKGVKAPANKSSSESQALPEKAV